MVHTTMEVTMSSHFVLLMYCLSSFLLTWLLDYKQVLNRQRCLLFSALLLLPACLFLLHIPLQLSVPLFFIVMAVKYFFYIQSFRSWLPGALLMILKYVLIVLSWFLTFDLPRIFWGMAIFNSFSRMLLFHIVQQFVLLLFAFGMKHLMIRLHFIYRLHSLTFAYKKIALASLLLVTALSILRQSHSYPQYTATFVFSLFVIVLLLAVSFFIIWITSEKQSQVIALQMKNQYLTAQQKMADDLRDFKHDYKNMLIVLAEYLEQEQYQQAKQYLQEILDYSHETFDLDYYADLYKLKNIDLQNYLFTFIAQCKAQQIKFTLTVQGQSRLLPIPPVQLIRMMSIISNNALEACIGKPNQFIHLFIEFTEKTIALTMTNTCSEKVNLQKIMTTGYSTKAQHSGRGLAFLEKAAKELGAQLTLTQQKNLFTVEILFK